MKKIIVLLLLMVASGLLIPVILESGEQKDQANEIGTVIKGAVEDTSWMNAKSEQQVKDLLSQYFAGELLERNTTAALNFIDLRTDWYWQTNVESIHIIYLNESKAMAIVTLIDRDLNDINNTHRDKAAFYLHNTVDGWRIFDYRYHKDW
ncbi:hypothetical protein [Desulfofalx alkaliphila]|uniref:hypothetical protein n=1 Tax=Desulfofalx alkaliphila TaxID=105483 RepID=UPI0004E1D7C8|nr:hypothetical protein [Desulfofalx alkaliphila]